MPQQNSAVGPFIARLLTPLGHGRHDAWLLARATLIFLTCAYINCIATSLSDAPYQPAGTNQGARIMHTPEEKDGVVLDSGLTFFRTLRPRVPYADRLPEALVTISAMLLFVRAISLARSSCLVLRRVLLITGFMYLLRAAALSMTTLPKVVRVCRPERHWNLFFDALLIMTHYRVACGDVFFSGHSIIFTLNAAFWITYSTRLDLCLPVVALSVFGFLSLLMASIHYSIDIFTAVLLSLFVFATYHWVADGLVAKNEFWGNALRALDGATEYQSTDTNEEIESRKPESDA